MSIEERFGEKSPDSEPEYDTRFYAVIHGAGSFVINAVNTGWFPRNAVDIFDGLFEADVEVREGAVDIDELRRHAMNMLIGEAWWIDFAQKKAEYSKCNLSNLATVPSEVIEYEYVVGSDEKVNATEVLNMQEEPLIQIELDRISKLMSELARSASAYALHRLDQVVILDGVEDDRFLYLTPTTILIGRGLLGVDEFCLIFIGNESYTIDQVFEKVGVAYAKGPRIAVQSLEVSRIYDYRPALPKPVSVIYGSEDDQYDMENGD